ncbi:C2H2 type zinc-finger-domain-containing protein [Neocallimastix lanati (nom. inval.)]|jgi:pre-60S factor REI1|nr:C2H2 type zinc-finger-domain-containing protein [Neocallimastix sp. JGI-2020a]
MDVETASEFSEQSVQAPLYTCLTCKVAFRTADIQREHYRQDWHRYNLKRKVAGLQPISHDLFKEKIAAQEKDKPNENEKSSGWNCEACKKSFSTENAYKNHVVSKKHLESVAKFEKRKASKKNENKTDLEKKQSMPKINWKKKLAEAQTEEEVNKVIDEKIKLSRRLEETECLFCDFKGKTLEEKMEHMTIEHTFFIPDIEYLVDLKGFMNYLAEKIAIGNTCIYCKKAFNTLEATRKHILDKGHQKIKYEEGPDLEISDFYDFSSTYDDDVNPDEELDPNYNVLTITSEGTELILPSGAHIGHREYKRYYDQNLRYNYEPESVAINRLTQKYKALGYYNIGSSGMTIEQERLAKMKAAREELRQYQRRKEMLGIKNNDLQKHFRKQII